MMTEQCKIIAGYARDAYISHRWTRLVLCAGIGMTGFLLWQLCGGFPPWAWRFLAQVTPRLPELWVQRGLTILAPFVGLLLQSIALLIAWGGLLVIVIKIVSHWRQEQRALRHFDNDIQKAQHLTNVMQQEVLYASTTLPLPVVARSSKILPSYSARLQGPLSHVIDDPSPTMTELPLIVPEPAPAPQRQLKHAPILPTYKVSPAPADYAVRNSVARQTSSHLLVATGLDTGIKRKGKPNEDNLLAFEHTRTCKAGTIPIGLFAIADGMGGHENGQVASRLATRVLRETVLPTLQNSPEDEIFPELLVEGIHRANLALYQQNRQRHGDMGTTLTAAIIFGGTAYVANVGDSRTYLYRCDEGLSQITRDHSTVARLVEAGAITRDEVYTHPMRNVIYRSLGSKASEEIDIFTVPLRIGDILMLCSDGLWEMVRDADIETIIRASYPYPSQMSTMLIQAALNRGGKDNISIVVVYVDASYVERGKAAPA